MTGGEYTEVQLRFDFYDRWDIWWAQYLDGWHLAARRRGATSEEFPLVRRTPAEMRDCLAGRGPGAGDLEGSPW